jgi:hypothetical protein
LSLVGVEWANPDQRLAFMPLVAEIRLLKHRLLSDRRTEIARQPVKQLQ